VAAVLVRGPTRWFLPETPDVLGMLRQQTAVTAKGIDAFAAWAAGDGAKADVVRSLEHEADEHKRELRGALRTAFSTPVEPEDLFELSRGIDAVLNGAKDAVREAEVMAILPDGALAQMAGLLAEGVHRLASAIETLASDGEAATDAADAAVKSQRHLERAYRAASAALLEGNSDLRTVAEQITRGRNRLRRE
jgi:hypothetical protein